MPLAINKDTWYVKDLESDNYRGATILSTTLPEDALQIIEDTQNALSIQETRSKQIIDDTQNSINSLDGQRQVILESIASIAGQGTDTTLTQNGVAADAAACGNFREEVKKYKNLGMVNNIQGTIATFNDGAGDIPIRKLTTKITTAQDLHGYENPWPRGSGKNLLPDTFPSNTITGSMGSNGIVKTATNATIFSIPCEPNTYYTLSDRYTYGWSVGFATEAAVIGTHGSYRGSMQNRSYFVINSEENTWMILEFTNRATFQSLISDGHGMVEKGAVQTTYEPYSNICPILGRTQCDIFRESTYNIEANPILTVSWENGIYGGILIINDDKIGTLIVDKGFKTFNNSEGWTELNGAFYQDNVFNNTELTSATDKTNFKCNIYKEASFIASPEYVLDCPDFSFFNQYTEELDKRDRLWIKDSKITSLEELNTAFSTTPLQIVYPLAEPIYFTITTDQIITLFGENNIWTSDKDISIDYYMDTKFYVDEQNKTLMNNIAPIENNNVSSQQYQAGSFFFHNEQFCKALTTIESNEEFILNINYETTTIAAILTSLQS